MLKRLDERKAPKIKSIKSISISLRKPLQLGVSIPAKSIPAETPAPCSSHTNISTLIPLHLTLRYPTPGTPGTRQAYSGKCAI